MKGNRFFKPFVGSMYHHGINGKKILVLGASFYCNKDGKDGRYRCQFFDECTNPVKKDSSRFNLSCPIYAGTGLRLSEEPSNAISENYKTYQVFANFIRQFVEDKDEDVWQRMAFTDYLQFFSPTVLTHKEYLSQRDFDAFCETLHELQPHIVVAWGMQIIEEIREHNPYVTDLEALPKTEWYVCHMRISGIAHEIALICCYHPSSISYWYNNLDVLTKYLQQVLNGKL